MVTMMKVFQLRHFANPAENEFGQLLQVLCSLRPNTAPKQKAKLQEPDPFDGSDSRKLRTMPAQLPVSFIRFSEG